MGEGQKRTTLQKLATAKLGDAVILFDHGRFSGAYYMAGYAVEFGLKACIAQQITAEVIPPKDFIIKTHTHALSDLVGLAGLRTKLQEMEQADNEFATYWAIAVQWHPNIRYETVDKRTAHLMIEGLTRKGIFAWIKKHW